MLDLALADVAGLEEVGLGVGLLVGDAAEGAGGDDVAGLEGHLAEEGDEGGDVEDHVGEALVLADVAVDAGFDEELIGVRHFVGSDQIWPDGVGGVEVLAEEDAAHGGGSLDLAGGDVVVDGVAGDDAEGVLGGDVFAALADDDADFDFVVEAVGLARANDRLFVRGEGRIEAGGAGDVVGGLVAGVFDVFFGVEAGVEKFAGLGDDGAEAEVFFLKGAELSIGAEGVLPGAKGAFAVVEGGSGGFEGGLAAF